MRYNNITKVLLESLTDRGTRNPCQCWCFPGCVGPTPRNTRSSATPSAELFNRPAFQPATATASAVL